MTLCRSIPQRSVNALHAFPVRMGKPSVIAAALFLSIALGCARNPNSTPIPTDPEHRVAEITRLEARITADRRALEDLVTRPKDESAPELHDDQGLREIAERLAEDTRRLEQIKGFHLPGGPAAARP